MKLLILIVLWTNISFAYTVDIYDTARPGKILIEVIDDCNYSHKLLVSLELSATYKTTDWIELLIVSGEWNKCKVNAKNALTK